ncbi:putative site-specific integrase-resolvase [Frankia torreyi]|uniref:Putative site-specific integrase-resolvase n=1 Tax=Frankia torreyi TaxID=1856 RepID=A0A0D8BFP6_9ACTN|nr:MULTISPECIES: IS607 family transposase [Frankia]KJE22875.1 putative site-specific integrase-resolvase [Frankia torreyi]KQC40288.1 resolvase [Frankia sp. ACN1ag]KQM04921.1 putative site-specific integrase-resolvase [Frankia sp. CpI1-P]
MNLKEWAAANGVGYSTARQWFLDGKLPVPARRVGGLILVDQPARPVPSGTVAVYARVSSANQMPNLDRQVARIVAWTASQNLAVGRVVTEVGSALDGHRRKFLALLRDPDVTTIVVEHRGRFARFGAEDVQAALEASGRRLLVVDPAEVDDDLVRDITEILTSMCARLYGRGAAANRAARAVAAATEDRP